MKVILHKLFPYAPYLNEYIGFEMEVAEKVDGSDMEEVGLEATKRLRKLAEQSHRDRYPNLYEKGNESLIQSFAPPIQQQEKTPTKDERIQSFIATINMCTTLRFLNNFKKRVEEENNDKLSEAWAIKYDQLYQLEIQKYNQITG